MNPEKILLAWSGGKDSALALHELRKSGQYDVVALLTTVTEDYDRVSMHGVRRVLLERQAACARLSLEEVYISAASPNGEYEAKMREVLERYLAAGVSAVAFGDIFLADVRRYREENLAQVGMRGVFPLWGRDTTGLAHAFVDLGFKALITCVDSQVLDRSFVGREFDRTFVSDLPFAVDPCGENGAFHSFVYDGPVFREPIRFVRGSVVLREERFYYCDLIPRAHHA